MNCQNINTFIRKTSLFMATVLIAGILTFQTNLIAAPADDQVNTSYENALKSHNDGDADAAIIHLKNALQANPKHLPSRILMAEIQVTLNNGPLAEIELDFARDNGADTNRLVTLYGRAYLLQNQYKKVLDEIRPGNRGKQTETEVAFIRGQAYLGQRKLANADKSFSDALMLTPDHDNALLGRARVATIYKKYDDALIFVDRALEKFDPTPNAWVMKSKLYKLQGENEQALSAINEALNRQDDNFSALLTRAALLIDEQRYDDALVDVDKILEEIPTEPQAKYLKAIINAATGDEDKTTESVNEIINTLRTMPEQYMSDNPIYFYLAGLTNFQLENLGEGREYLKKYLAIEPDDIRALRLLGALELQAGNPTAASVPLTTANRLQPGNPTILTLLATTYLETGRFEKANRILSVISEALPENPQAYANLARGKYAEGSFQEAIESLLKAREHNLDSTDVGILLAQSYRQAGNIKEALKISRKLLKENQNSSYLHQLYGSLKGLDGDNNTARESYNRALEIDPENQQAHIYLARMDLLEEQPEKGIERLKARLKKTPQSALLMVEIAGIYEITNDPKEALFWYKKAYSQDNDNFPALRKLVNTFLAENQLSQAIEAANEYSNRHPENSDIFQLLGRLYLRDNRQKEAITAFRLSVDYARNRGQALLVLARAQNLLNDLSGAASSLRKAIAWDAQLVEAYITLIRIEITNKQYAEALDLIDTLRKLDEESPGADLLTADLYYSQDNFTKSAEYYQTALEFGVNPVAILGLHNSYKYSGRIDKSITMLEDWSRQYPEELVFGLTLGDAYRLSGDLNKSVSYYQQLEQKFPNTPQVLNNLANLLYDTGKHAEGLKAAREAFELAPNSHFTMDTLAWIETREGNPEAALPLLRRAQVINFNSGAINYHLAITLDKLGRRKEAYQALSDALNIERGFEDREEALKIMEKWKAER